MQRGEYEYHDIYDAGFDEAGNPIPAPSIEYHSDYERQNIMVDSNCSKLARRINNNTPKSTKYADKKRSIKYRRSKIRHGQMLDKKIKSNAIEKILQQEFNKEVNGQFE